MYPALECLLYEILLINRLIERFKAQFALDSSEEKRTLNFKQVLH